MLAIEARRPEGNLFREAAMIIFRASRMYFANEGMSRNYDLSVAIRGHISGKLAKSAISAALNRFSSSESNRVQLSYEMLAHLVHNAQILAG